MKYSIKTSDYRGFYAFLSHKNRTSWCLKTAKKHAKEFKEKHDGLYNVEVVEA